MDVVPRPLTVVTSGPEQLFGVSPVAQEGAELVATMPLGPGTRVGGRPQAAALGVLVDDVLGYAVNTLAAGWSVSTEVSMDLLAPLPAYGWAECRARIVHVDATGAVTEGVVTVRGDVVARAVLRGRFRDHEPDPAVLAAGRTVDVGPVDRTDLDTVLGGGVAHRARGLTVRASSRFANPLGNLHGGMHVCFHERAAALAAPALPTTASVRVQLVRGVPTGADLELVPRVLHAGRTLAVVGVEARDGDGRLCSAATVVRHHGT